MTRMFAATAPADPSPSPAQRNAVRLARLGSGQPTFCEIADFLVDEAQLLDEGRTHEWLELLAPDVFYWMPVRRTVSRRRPSGFDPQMAYLYETLPSLQVRIGRTDHNTAYSEDPPSRSRRMVSNIVVHSTDRADEWTADSSFLLLRDHGEDGRPDQLSGRREDILRRTPDGWRLAQRIILVDQTVLATPNMGIFL